MSKVDKIVTASNDDTIRTARFNPVSKIYRWIKVSGLTSTLQQLDDRTLNDIGIARGDIHSFAKKLIANEHNSAA